MTFKRVAIFALPLLVAVSIGLTAGAAQAAGPVCAVPGDYSAIQLAVNDPGCGTINVAAGTYNEQVQISRTLTLRGAQAGIDARTRSGPESVITNTCGPVQIMADKVTVDGFTIQDGSDPSSGCFFSGIWTNPGFGGTQGGHQILNNIIQNNISGLELDNTGTFPTIVRFNLFRNNNNPGPGSGNAIQTNFGLANATIDSNKFVGHTSSSVLVVAASTGITVSNNELVGGTPEGIALLNVSNSAISGNTSLGSTAFGTIDLFGGDNNIAVTANVLANGTRGIVVEDPYGVGPNSAVSAHANCLSGNSAAGLEADTGGYTPVVPNALNAKNNWWGKSSGPTIASNPGGAGDKIVDPDGVVAFSPWTTTQPASPCPAAATPRSIKQGVLTTLQGLLPTGNKDTDKKIADAIDHLQKSLDPSLWVDGSHLNAKKGDKVFDEEKEAVKKLMDIKSPSATITGAINSLWMVDKTLAQTAIDEMTAGGGDPKKLAEANKEMAKAQDEISKGHFDAAIDHYENAWKQAQKA